MKLLFILFNLLAVLSITSCKESPPQSSEKEILSFSVPWQTNEAVILSYPGTIFVQVDTNTNLTEIIPVITVSENAIISPASGEVTGFSNGPVDYLVTAQDNSTKKWTVTVEKQKSDDAEIIRFYLSRQKSDPVFADSTITVEMKVGTYLSALKPEISVSAKASVQPASGEAADFSTDTVIYTVTAQSGKQKKWYVSVAHEKTYEANILTYTIPNQIGESVFEGTSIYVEVPLNYDLTHVIPAITITEGTTISPQSGEAVNFEETGYVDYEITTEVNSKKVWRVYVTETMIKPNNPFIQYMGRIDFTDSLKPKLFASGASIITKFKGTHCQILLNDQIRYGSYHNYLEIVVDGSQATRIQTTAKNNTIDLVSNLSEGEHTLMIIKTTEASIGYIEFLGFRCDELLEPDPLPIRRIEFIGNSITCGYGVDNSQTECGAGEWYDQHNAYLAYGPVLAQRLSAQWMLTSVSGIGLIHSCCDMTYTMPDVYHSIDMTRTGIDWNFTEYPADVVTICLGQNDGILDSATFCGVYVNFIGTIRSKYPNARIVCLTSPMADEALANSQVSYLTGIVNHMHNQNDSKVYKFVLSHGMNSGCDYHPNAEQHQQIADELETFFKETFGW